MESILAFVGYRERVREGEKAYRDQLRRERSAQNEPRSPATMMKAKLKGIVVLWLPRIIANAVDIP